MVTNGGPQIDQVLKRVVKQFSRLKRGKFEAIGLFCVIVCSHFKVVFWMDVKMGFHQM